MKCGLAALLTANGFISVLGFAKVVDLATQAGPADIAPHQRLWLTAGVLPDRGIGIRHKVAADHVDISAD